MKPNQSTHNQRGVSALEFTIIAPLVFVLIFGMIEFGCLFYDKALITNASREGARAGIGNGDHTDLCEADIKNKAATVTKSYLYKDTNFTKLKLIYFGSKNDPGITPNIIHDTSNGSNYKLSVQISWTYRFLVLPNFKNLGWVNLNPTITLNAETVMMMESDPSC